MTLGWAVLLLVLVLVFLLYKSSFMDSSIKFYNEILKIISIIAILVMFIPIVIAILNKKYLNKQLRFAYYFILCQCTIAILLQVIYRIFGIFRLFFIPILNKYRIIDMSFMSIFSHVSVFILVGMYFAYLFEHKKLVYFIKMLIIFFTVSSIVNYLFIEGYNVQSVYNSITAAIFCIFLSLLHLWFIFNDIGSKVNLVKNPYYWIDLGLLLPNIIALLMYCIGKKLEETDNSIFLLSNIFSDVIQMIGYFLIAVGFYYARFSKYMPKANK
jgi:hypothetical protein